MKGKPIAGESPDYRRSRDTLLSAEHALIEQREVVAALRRELPLGARVQQDYLFREGPGDIDDQDPEHHFDTHFSELFADGHRTLIVQHLMFAPDADRACPMCSMWVDGFNAIAGHVAEHARLVVVARTQLHNLRRFGRERGWDRVRLLSSYGNSFNPDFNVEITPERQLPGISIFTEEERGGIYHRYTTEGSLEERHHRHMDLYTPVWTLLDLLPGGRGDWMPGHVSRDD